MSCRLIVALLGLVALSLAQDLPSAATTTVVTPQDRVLAHSSTGNFACKIDMVEVTQDTVGDEDKKVFSPEDLEAFLSQTASLEWAHVNQFFFSSFDGRNDEKNLGTGGGDLGEFIQALQAYTKITGVVLTADEVEAALERYLTIMSRTKFYLETDEKAYRKLAIATGCQNLKIAEIGDKHKKQAILDKFAAPEMAEFIGDPYIKFLALNAADLGLKPEYVTYGLQAFHINLWKTGASSQRLCYTMLKGRLDPKAFIRIKTPAYCVDQGLAPLVSSQMCSGQTFVQHVDSVKLFRRELVQLLARPGDNPQDILAEFNKFAQANTDKFWDTFVGLPSFTVTFSHSTPLLQEDAQ